MRLRAFAAALLLTGAGLPATPPPAQAEPPSDQSQSGPAQAGPVEARIAELRKRLRITPAEQPQWDAFAQVMRENAAHMDRFLQDPAAVAKLNAVQGMRGYAEMAQAHAEDMQRLLPAFEALYNAMSPEQQRLADQAFRNFEQRLVRRGPMQP